MDKNEKKDLLIIYNNYLHALQEREEYGDKYGDTEEIIKLYEEVLIRHKVLKSHNKKR